MPKNLLLVLASVFFAASPLALHAEGLSEPCPRPVPGSAVTDPEDLRSRNGLLKVELTVHDSKQGDGSTRYCYTDANGRQSPTLRVNPGDLVVLTLKNDLTDFQAAAAATNQHLHKGMGKTGNACTADLMTSVSTNLHFHGLTIPPVCHQDDVLKTSVQPGDAPFEYRFRIPLDEPPGCIGTTPIFMALQKSKCLAVRREP
jgi:FtsP/CotA-like multicopper oxidase with cupredoxin domain